MNLNVKRFDKSLPLPGYAKPGDSGLDLRAAEDTTVPAGKTVKVRLGVAVEIVDPGYEAQIRPRSGLASEGIVVQFGTVDSGYRGELKAVVTNLTKQEVTIGKGFKIAQLVIAPVCRVTVVDADTLSETVRGSDGFGSTGVA